jgi:exodeoxyribonuclease VII small subunit
MANATTSAGVATGSTAAPLHGSPELGFDQILARLREVVIRLESGELSLEQSLVIYEEGVRLARRGQQLLTSAERRVEILVSASGGVEVVPFDESTGGGDQASGAGGKAARAIDERDVVDAGGGAKAPGGIGESGPG